MFEHTKGVVHAAERAENAAQAIQTLRQLGLDGFALILLTLPREDLPNLSRMLPRMASAKTQETWTGACGTKLLAQTIAFVRTLESLYMRHTGQALDGKRILDFGCGYGRVVRLLYYYTDYENIFGVDAWQKSLDFCTESRLLGNFSLSETLPKSLPVEDADLAFAFSILTHLSEDAMRASLAAVRRSVVEGGLFVVTIRPIEFWAYNDGNTSTSLAAEMEPIHRERGFAFQPNISSHYGETSMTVEYLRDLPGWEVVSTESSLIDMYQIVVALRAVPN